jgi:peptidoglycan/LPS O-acetylase OafA/YrhL
LAAFVVIIHHIELSKLVRHLPNLYDTHDVVKLIGSLGVDLFFVLSGFLITSLLFVEQATPTGIKVGNFIMRRVLRIWPLYFIIVILAFVLPAVPIFNSHLAIYASTHPVGNILLAVLFLPHLQRLIYAPTAFMGHLWSIGIEEQFYLVWSSVVKKLSTVKLVNWILAYILLYMGIMLALNILQHINYQPGVFKINYERLLSIVDVFRFDCLLIGALFAVMHKNLKANSIITHKLFQLFVYLLEAVLVYKANWFYGFFWEAHAVLYGLIILNLVRPETSLINIDYKLFDALGKISYGIYMYHPIVISLVLALVYKYKLEWLTYPAVYIITIVIAWLSYRFVESYFLKLKHRFSVISTG